MRVIQLETWEAFEEKIAELLEKQKKRVAEAQSSVPKFGRHSVSPLLFRGEPSDFGAQENATSEWPKKENLQTTLERCSSREFGISDYHRVMWVVRSDFETHTGKTWNLRRYEEYDYKECRPAGAPPGYDFMVYLRHLGFPSPLLDWTRSPYIAAFFAFRSAEASLGDKVAIFVYQEFAGNSKIGTVGKPHIVGCGPYVTTHPRHSSQQAEYTICKKKGKGGYVYCSHAEVFQKGDALQDILLKFTLPKTEREKVREKLETMNINAFSLFNDDATLAESLAYREIERKFP